MQQWVYADLIGLLRGVLDEFGFAKHRLIVLFAPGKGFLTPHACLRGVDDGAGATADKPVLP
jgi:hypothetical protein